MVAADIRFAPEEELFRRYASDRDPQVRAELVHRYLGFARAMALRYEGRGEAVDDLVQVASLGLIGAIERFEPDKGKPFLAFAAPTVLGELRRHFRDRVLPLRLPRALQERTAELDQATSSLTRELGRPPTADELADQLGLEQEDILEALQAASARRIRSLDAPAAAWSDSEPEPLGERLGEADPGYEHVENWNTVVQLLPELSDRERAALRLRLVDDLTQTEIGNRLGCSQMHVSRMLRRSLDRLRQAYEDGIESGFVRREAGRSGLGGVPRIASASNRKEREMSDIIDKATGKAKQAVGDVTGDDELRREGLEEERKGEKKEELADAEEKADEKAEEVAEAERRTA
jgi:RNA polymerase sigma-B factor